MKIVQLSQSQDVSMSNDWFELADPGHFWIEWRFRILKKMVEKFVTPDSRILEIGCGNGLAMWQMENYFQVKPDGCDLNPNALSEMFPVSGNVFLYDIFDLNQQLTGKYEMVIMLDVLEHITEDRNFFETALKYLKPGGRIVVGVPAHQHLYSKYDRLVGHVRRYEKEQLLELFNSSGIVGSKVDFWGLTLLPLLRLRKSYLNFISDEKVIQTGFKPPHPLFNLFMRMVMRLETNIFNNPLTGISLLATGRLPE